MNRLRRLIRKLAIVQLHSDDAPDVTHPKLPLELIYRIPFFTAPRVVISARCGQNEDNTDPWILAEVCSAWRAIVLADANMWTHIVIYIDFPERKSGQRLRRGCIARLRRSLELSYPLSISFHLALAPRMVGASKQQDVRWPETVDELLRIIYAERSRIVSLDLPNLPVVIPMLGPGMWDHLTELTLTRFDRRLYCPSYQFTAPRLRQITSAVEMIPPLHSVDWTQITNLALETCTVDGQVPTSAVATSPIYPRPFILIYWSLYKTADVLETLEVRTPSFGPLAHGPLRTFLKLRYLSILSASKNANNGQESSFLDMIRCPALEILYVESASRLSEFIDFVRHGAADTLHTLILGKPLLRECASGSWASLFKVASSLRTIVLVGLQAEHPLVDALLHTAVDDQLQRIFLVDAPDPGQLVDVLSGTWICGQVPTWEAEWEEFVGQTTDAIVKMARHSGSLDILDSVDPPRERRLAWKMLVPR